MASLATSGHLSSSNLHSHLLSALSLSLSLKLLFRNFPAERFPSILENEMSEVAKPLNSEVHSLFMHECIHPCIHPHMYLCIHPSHHLSIQPTVHPFILICLPIHPFISTHSFTFYTFIQSSSHTVIHVHHSYIHLPTHSSVHLSIYIPPTHSYIHLFCCFKVLRAEFKTLCTPPNQEFYH